MGSLQIPCLFCQHKKPESKADSYSETIAFYCSLIGNGDNCIHKKNFS